MTVSSLEMYVADRNAEWLGVPRLVLMKNARSAVAEALKPREPPEYRMRFYDYLMYTTLRSPAGRALALAEYMAKGGRPEAMEEELRRAAERGTAWMPPYVVREAEAVVHG